MEDNVILFAPWLARKAEKQIEEALQRAFESLEEDWYELEESD